MCELLIEAGVEAIFGHTGVLVCLMNSWKVAV